MPNLYFIRMRVIFVVISLRVHLRRLCFLDRAQRKIGKTLAAMMLLMSSLTMTSRKSCTCGAPIAAMLLWFQRVLVTIKELQKM